MTHDCCANGTPKSCEIGSVKMKNADTDHTSMKNPKQNTSKSDHFFLCERTIIESPLFSLLLSTPLIVNSLEFGTLLGSAVPNNVIGFSCA